MVAYRPPAYRPAAVHPALAKSQMGSIQSMDIGDWLLLLGGGIVGGAGVNGLIENLMGPRINAISLALNLVLTAIGGTLFVQKFGKLTS